MGTVIVQMDVVEQSREIHPDWDAEDHRNFLLFDADECFDPKEVVDVETIERWLVAR